MDALHPSFENDLLRLARRRSRALSTLRARWPEVRRRIRAQREALVRTIREDDPLRLGNDLLAPIGRSLDETSHTQAIAYLLDPAAAHGFRRAILVALLQKVRAREARRALQLLQRRSTRISVTPEYRRDGAPVRCDVWIELHAAKRALLIVIENKIDAPEGNEQLSRYAVEARKWCKSKGREALLIYLTRHARSPRQTNAQWHNLSYLQLAAALRLVWRRRTKRAGSAWLGLYIASIARSVLGIEFEHLHETPLDRLRIYLGKSNAREENNEGARRLS